MGSTSRKEDEYLTNYTFEVQLGMSKINFAKISNISTDLEYEIIGDGGNNDRMQFFEKPNRRPDTIVFEKGLKKESDAGMAFVVVGMKFDNIMILVKKGMTTERIFFIEQGIVTRIGYTDLDAGRGEILIKRIELQHTGIVEMMV